MDESGVPVLQGVERELVEGVKIGGHEPAPKEKTSRACGFHRRPGCDSMNGVGGLHSMQTLRRCLVAVSIIVFACHLPAQKEKRQTLTEAQIEAIREAGIFPEDRLNLYTKYVDEYAERIKELSFRKSSGARAKKLDDQLLDMTSLMDELDDNLEQYTDRKADVRGALKKLNDAVPQWVRILNALAGEPAFDESRKDAIEDCEELEGDVKRLLTEQTDYFNLHKDQRGQQRALPN